MHDKAVSKLPHATDSEMGQTLLLVIIWHNDPYSAVSPKSFFEVPIYNVLSMHAQCMIIKSSLNRRVHTERRPSQVDHLSVYIVKLKKILYKNDRHLQAQHPGHPYLNQNKLVVLTMDWLPWLQTS